MPPGWYPDPAGLGGLRWWDGYSWAAATRPLDADGFDPEADLKAEADAARPASLAVLAGSAVYLAQFVVSALSASRIWHEFRVAFDEGQNNNNVPAPSFGGTSLFSEVLELGLLIVGVLFIIWLRRAAVLARRAGLPAKRDPLWAVLGFFVPVVNYWFPYQVARDIFPPGHPGRGLVKRWWTLWIAMTVAGIPIFIVGAFSTPAAAVLACAAGGIAFWCALVARQMITAAAQAHATLLGH